jgi:hypothetical protein
MEKLDAEGVGDFVERVFGRARFHSRLWIAGWLSAILAMTAVAAIWHAPTAAYVILGLVAVVMIFADGRPKGD